MSRWCFAAVFSVLLSAGIATPRGDIVALRKFNDGLESTHTSFPEGHRQAAQRQVLRGDLAAFDPHCSSCTPDGFTHSHLPKGGGHAILSDKALSLLHPNGSLLQVAPLSQSCIPLYLQPSLIDPSIPFLVVCRNSCYQGVTWDKGAISLTLPTACGQSGGVFVESHGELFLVTYSDGAIDEYSFASATFYSPPLPDVHCEGSGDLYPLHGQESYLLRCNTADGPALYVISLSIHGSQVRPISAIGRPQSAPDGEHFIVVNGRSLRLYVTGNETVTPQAKTFSSDITHTEFMNSRYLSLSTEGGENVLVDIQHIFSVSAAGEAIVKLIGGPPLAMLWIDPDVYVYITRDATSALHMHFHNATSGKDLEKGGEIVDVPDLLVFMETQKTVDPPPGRDVGNGGKTSGLHSGLIALIVIGGLLLLLTLGGCVVGAVYYQREKNRHSSPSSSSPSIEMLLSASDMQNRSAASGSSTPAGSTLDSQPTLDSRLSTPDLPDDPPAQPVSPPVPQGVPTLESRSDNETEKEKRGTVLGSNIPDHVGNTSSDKRPAKDQVAGEMEKPVQATQDKGKAFSYPGFNKPVSASVSASAPSFPEGDSEDNLDQHRTELVVSK